MIFYDVTFSICHLIVGFIVGRKLWRWGDKIYAVWLITVVIGYVFYRLFYRL